LNLERGHEARSAKKIFFALPSLEPSRARARPRAKKKEKKKKICDAALISAGTKREAQRKIFDLYSPCNHPERSEIFFSRSLFAPQTRARSAKRKTFFFRFTFPGTLEGAGTAPRK